MYYTMKTVDSPSRHGLIEGEDDENQYIIDLRRYIASRQEDKAITSSTNCDDAFAGKPLAAEAITQVNGVSYKKQQGREDCGQTALEMIGISHTVERDRQVSTADLFRLEEAVVFNADVEGYDAFVPQKDDVHIMLNAYPGRVNHWVVVTGDKVLDPARGVFDYQTYSDAYRPRPLAIYTKAPTL